ncbi:DNA-dependent RNA polymerase subunit epsilon [Halalkalibacter oceani]|uniref:DNA-directed RNA polymerase subunit epsilon n=1 Tax=Halalkalibacter oceani TaxID=1653776 RepID=A0A9X2IMH5_9BACI|nr:DNA-directed RNA polymerase subunit epsilon [Halalkalibacter oceani]MCM3713030.1 DNA-directed RNA polymerase subunit epsilon [Halalkalibacter oceani]
MIYKVFFQENFKEVPVREYTEAIYVEAESEADVRRKLAPRKYNIEFITPISGAFLEYEENKEDFKVESL